MQFNMDASISLSLVSICFGMYCNVNEPVMKKKGNIIKKMPIFIVVKFFLTNYSAKIGSIVQKWLYARPGAIDANINLEELINSQ